MLTKKNGRKKGILLAGSIILFCITAALVCMFLFVHRVRYVPSDKMRDVDIATISRGNYEAVILSMYTPESFSADEFGYFLGIASVQAFHPFVNLADIGDYLEQSFSSNDDLSLVYIGLDPFAVSRLYGYHTFLYAKDYEKYLTEYVQVHNNVVFKFLIPAYSMEYMRSLSDNEYTELINAYRNLVNLYTLYDNVDIYFLGDEEWLIANPGNYASPTNLNTSVLRTTAAYSLQDDRYAMTLDNMEEHFDQMTELVQDSFITYPDLSEWCMLFFGDSIFEYLAGSRSVSGVVEGMSGAQVYNCSQGGIPATEDPEALLSFNRMVTRFLEQDISGLDEVTNFQLELTDYIQENHEGKRYCFVLNYGLNDYFGGHPVENPANEFDVGTYAGALRTGISTLKEAYPEAVIILLTPTYTGEFSGGTEINGDRGSVLTDYVEAAVGVAQDMDVFFINNYTDSGINADTQEIYLADMTHPNETGAFLLGRHILDEMKKVIESLSL